MDIIQIINEEIQNQFNFKLNEEEDRITITAFFSGSKIGGITSEMLFEPYQYEFDDVFSEEEFDSIFPKDDIIKIEHIEMNDGFKSQGIATKLMIMMMDLMKTRGYTQFYLNASPMGFSGLNLSQLTNFYRNFGFKEILHQGNNVLMAAIF